MRPALLVQALICALCVAAVASVASAHGGGLNAAGCHADRKTGDYHCHRTGGILGSGVPPAAALAGELPTPRSAIKDVDCSDFGGSWRAAQDFYEAAGPGDPHNLDADKEGLACEALLPWNSRPYFGGR